jgi:Cu/Zn superoxide dismutase
MRKLIPAALVAAGLLAASPVAAGGRPFTTTLDAANEVGQPGDVGATGNASITLNQGQETVCFEITVSGLTAPILAAHIHEAPVDANGGIVVNFDIPANGLAGCVSADADLIKAIRQHPDDYYVNVHNATAPAGAARGQLSK